MWKRIGFISFKFYFLVYNFCVCGPIDAEMQRFIPSEFGLDPDKTQISGMDYNFYSNKAEIRRLVESQGIPYTFVSCNFYTSYLLPSLVQPGLKGPPRDKVTIFGDGNTKGS